MQCNAMQCNAMQCNAMHLKVRVSLLTAVLRARDSAFVQNIRSYMLVRRKMYALRGCRIKKIQNPTLRLD
jgi:hypothetical protein